jgi:hypothetical protein
MNTYGDLRSNKSKDEGRHNIFPLPYIPVPNQKVSFFNRSKCSRRQYRRHHQLVTWILLVNVTIWTLNQMAAPAPSPMRESVLTSPLSSSSFHACVIYYQSNNILKDWSRRTTSQSRVLSHLWDNVLCFYSQLGIVAAPVSSGCRSSCDDSVVGAASSLPSGPVLLSFLSDLFSLFNQQQKFRTTTTNNCNEPDSDNVQSITCQSAANATFSYGDKADMVPLISSRLSLPDTALYQVDMMERLPENVRSVYADPDKVLLTLPERHLRQLRSGLIHGIKPRRSYVNGERTEYISMVKRMRALRMLDVTLQPKAVNSVFAVSKDADSDRLIIDAQEANDFFVESPIIHLPNPSHLASLQVPHGHKLMVAKTDLSNYYHHIRIPNWIGQYLCLPALSYAELGMTAPVGVDPHHPCVYPMCTTLPMGWSHSVYVAQVMHEHALYNTGTLEKKDNVLNVSSALIRAGSAIHSIYIDDLVLITVVPIGDTSDSVTVPDSFAGIFHSVLACYAATGLVVKQSKVVSPTCQPVLVLGVELHTHVIAVPSNKMKLLLRQTVSVLRSSTVTGQALSELVGSWCWVMLLNRSSLSVLRHVWRYIAVAGDKPYALWKSVRKELFMLLGVATHLQADLSMSWHEQIIATDASQDGAGVVTTVDVNSTILKRVWPVAHHKQQYAGAETGATWCVPVPKPTCTSKSVSNRYRPFHASYHLTQPALHKLTALPNPPSFDKLLKRQRWRVIVNHPWRYKYKSVAGAATKNAGSGAHINALESNSLLLGLRWLSSRRDGMRHRVIMCVDSSVLCYALLKGRSSSSLHVKVREISGLCLALDVRVLPVWIPSAWNPADAPSRMFPMLLHPFKTITTLPLAASTRISQ